VPGPQRHQADHHIAPSPRNIAQGAHEPLSLIARTPDDCSPVIGA
jgi:hypothetical protein